MFGYNRDMTEIYFSMRKIFLTELKVGEEAVVTEENPPKNVLKYGIKQGVRVKLLGKTASGGVIVYYSGNDENCAVRESKCGKNYGI